MLRSLLEEEYASLELELALLNPPREELQLKVSAFGEQMERVRREKEELRFLVREDHESLVSGILDEEVERFKKEKAEPLLQRFDAFFEGEATGLSGTSLNRALADLIREETKETFLDWRQDLGKRLSDAFQGMARMYMERAKAVANRILGIAGELFGLSFPRLETDIVLSDEGEFWFRIGGSPYGPGDHLRGHLQVVAERAFPPPGEKEAEGGTAGPFRSPLR
ncbi:MAG: hypothetical protein ACUVS1_02960 [Actinomycetota bacterium]